MQLVHDLLFLSCRAIVTPIFYRIGAFHLSCEAAFDVDGGEHRVLSHFLFSFALRWWLGVITVMIISAAAMELLFRLYGHCLRVFLGVFLRFLRLGSDD